VDYHYHKLWDGYCSVVHVFEASLRDIYTVAVTALYENQPQRAKELLSEVGDSFYRLEGAEAAYRLFNYELLGCLSAKERDKLGLAFAKRHTLERRRKWVSWKYYFRVRALPLPWWFRVSLNQAEFEQSRQLVDRIVRAARNNIIVRR